jgi:hypothetical protein
MKILLILFSTFLLTSTSMTQIIKYRPQVNAKLLSSQWDAKWITCTNTLPQGYGVYHFRKTFELKKRPQKFIIHVSGDNRYRLFVNEKSVCFGPARGDLKNWRFETIDIAQYLQKGKNVVAAQVWNMSNVKPLAQISNCTGFILQADSDENYFINTNASWKAAQNFAYQPISDFSYLNTYLVTGPFDSVDGSKYIWGWQKVKFDDSNWQNAEELDNGKPKVIDSNSPVELVPRTIPFMDESIRRILKIRRTEGIEVNDKFLKGKSGLVIPENRKVKILLDQTFLTVGYPELIVSGGKGSSIKIIYSEALYDKNNNKGNRNEIKEKEIKGYYDVFIADGNQNRLYRPLWMRTYRYIQLEINTKDQPLNVNDIYGIFTAYPLRENAVFESDNRDLQNIWNVGWQTARLCAGETYFDCPYYEQMQYVGDTRIQSLISLYVSGDDQLVRNAIKSIYDSIIPEGLTLSRYPCCEQQIIPPFSLFWISMIYDYYMLRDDREFVKSFLNSVNGVLDWYEKHINTNSQILQRLEYWNFTDWAKEWPWNNDLGQGGVPDIGPNGESSIFSLHLAYTLNQASKLFEAFNDLQKAEHYRKLAESINKSVMEIFWDENKKLFANTPKKDVFSQHANALAVLSGAISKEEGKKLMERVISDKTLVQCTFYFRFYLLQAMKQVGLGDKYIEMLEPWKEMLRNGLTTYAESPEPTRSDCHAWSASPNYDLLATVCGIEPAEAGFHSVKIEPHPGNLKFIKASMPHPFGKIKLELIRLGKDNITGIITLPKNLSGIFVWNNEVKKIHPGKNKI